jgi:hypothetical protein
MFAHDSWGVRRQQPRQGAQAIIGDSIRRVTHIALTLTLGLIPATGCTEALRLDLPIEDAGTAETNPAVRLGHDGDACSTSDDCASNHCDSGLCCAMGMCCTDEYDCPMELAFAPMCEDTSRCQGIRGDRACEDHVCQTAITPDDSACAPDTIARSCGTDAVMCNGERTQASGVRSCARPNADVPPPECDESDTRCAQDASLEACIAGVWVATTRCPFVCEAGQCTGACVPGERQCEGAEAGRPEVCDEHGAWTSEAACQFVCLDGACAGDCDPGRKRCVGLDIETCNAAGEWSPETIEDGQRFTRTWCGRRCVNGECL